MLSQKTCLVSLLSIAALALGVVSCGNNESATSGNGETEQAATNADLSGDIAIDGSSTVFPITEAMAEEFQKLNSKVRVTVGVSGTGGGFKKFCAGETDISDASRPIKKEEIEACEKAGIEYVELPVAYDAISVVVNPKNDWATCLTVEELNKIWAPDAQGKVTNWNQVRSSFPDQEISLYGPGTDSGTFDYFTDAVNGKEGASRGDYTASEDDNVIVQGVSNGEGAIGYFGLAYYEENQGSLKAVTIDDGDPSNGEGCVTPSAATVEDSTYQPLARPIFIYVKKDAISRAPVAEFVNFYLQKDNGELVKQVGYIPMPEPVYDAVQARFENQKTGSLFDGGSTVGVKIKDILEKEEAGK
ncbi:MULTISPECIES: PstS family phosphate ABC transporter substrate-binding protein [unclassified Coleofasciculus]|uniref:PstS family phosphate ABC transporter substrate-binding protein n=1 Tax=unclassified Coleofasciculus TaxID=2692782 RepID=UPI00188217A4|nr:MULTISPECIES: PstS family phosphate ABC transporter substrate-binding protein [unclassified Coleofasciculus]MBE9129816.1 PstS family phosphate ABC transporter substrate-binding protein [Coleofasciculus sp. LEGE 07081]MBE9152279.1 PstS family phosphate ABC transporter substrate-binding protein [Coleofasciculus sp. LEGE 07092]